MEEIPPLTQTYKITSYTAYCHDKSDRWSVIPLKHTTVTGQSARPFDTGLIKPLWDAINLLERVLKDLEGWPFSIKRTWKSCLST